MHFDDEKFEIMYNNIEDIHNTLIKNEVSYSGLCGMEEALKKVESMFGEDTTIKQAIYELDLIKRM